MSPIQTLRHEGEHGAIVELRLARPPVNALDPALCRALVEAIRAAGNDGAVGIVLAAAPRSDGAGVFSAGLDVPYLLGLGADREAMRDAWQAFIGAAAELAACPVPVVAAIGGHAPAGGCVLALCCDWRLMAASADPDRPLRIGLNETQVGLPVPEGIQRLLRRTVGPRRAEQMLVTGAMATAEQALQIGLVDELAPVEEVGARARAWLQRLLALPRDAMLATRALARADLVEALQPAHINLEAFLGSWYAPGTQQALRAMLARLGKQGRGGEA